MSTITCTINNVSVPVLNASPQDAEALEVVGQLQITIIDASGVYTFTRGMPVVYSDSVSGIMFNGFVINSVPEKLSPDVSLTTIHHVVTAQGPEYRVNKRTNSTNYFNRYAGDVAVDMVVNGSLADEGVTVPANIHVDTSQSDFNEGILSGTVGTTTSAGDGVLELAKAGSDVSILEDLTADFSSGSLTNVQASSNSLTPTTQSAIKFQAVLQQHITTDSAYVQVWSGSQVVGTLDTLNYSIWIDPSSPAKLIAVDLGFNDGTFLRATTTAVDQNGLPAASSTDLSSYAVGQWYNRAISFPSSLNGKTVSSVLLVTTGTSAGTYTAYIKNIYLTSASGSPFFSTSATATNVNPPVVTSAVSYLPSQISATVVQTFDPTNSYRISPSHSIDAAKLLRSSLITWIAITPATSQVQLWASYDGVNYSQCTNNSALPNFPAGSVTASLNLYLKEVFTVTASTGNSSSNTADPTQLPVLSSVSVSLVSAPNPTSAKSDVVAGYGTQSNWNTGTHSGTSAPASGDLTIGATSRDWNNNLITSQTFTTQSGSPTQAATGGKYTMTTPASAQGQSNFDFAGQAADITLDMDVTVQANEVVYIYYRNPNKSNATSINTGYFFTLNVQSSSIQFAVNGGFLGPATSFTFTAGNTYHVTIIANGNLHRIYVGGSTTPQISYTDSAITSPGWIGVSVFNGGGGSITTSFDNFTLTPATSGTWTSPSTSISALGTCGLSVISWTELNTASQVVASVLVQTSVDGGSSYQNCTNGGGIPNIPSGTNVSGKSVIVKVTLTSISQVIAPIVRQLVVRVLGQYPGSSGTRSTAPLAIDSLTRGNVTGSWGTSQDGQSIAKNGTGTVNLTSNEGLIANTTGDCNMVYGSRTATDQEATVRFQLSASTITGLLKLRYVDSTHYYELSASTTTLSIIKQRGSTTTTLGTASVTLATATPYWLRFRIAGSGPINFYGRVWASGTLEDQTTWTVTGLE